MLLLQYLYHFVSDLFTFYGDKLGVIENAEEKINGDGKADANSPLLILGSTICRFNNVNVGHIMTISGLSSKIRGLQHWGR